MSIESAYSTIEKLVDDFRSNERLYTSQNYSEAAVRQDFIDKFFEALGWDVYHKVQKNPYEREVKIEKDVNVGDARKRADYAFSLAPNFGDPKFFVEAKKPARQLSNVDDYYQAIRYGWNSNMPFVVLTDFEEFHVIRSTERPKLEIALEKKFKTYHYTDYLDKEKFREIYYFFSREAVADGSIEKLAATLPKVKGKAAQTGLFAGAYKSIDESFLEELDGIRLTLAKLFKKSNQGLESEELTEAVQRTIDRLVFIRFLEDKLIEGETHIDRYGMKGSVWGEFIADSRKLDSKYNGVVFKEHLIDKPNFNAPDNNEFHRICEELCSKNSPFYFNNIPVHILGSIYEQFLGKVVHATAKQVKIEEKPEVRKAGGVYYTPQYIVKYIVENTVGKIIEGKSPKEIEKLRFADISCGSGSFLITVYDTLLNYIGKWYNNNPKDAKAEGCVMVEGVWILSLKQRRDILLNNVYGVDIDYQAVEVTQLSLFLKLLEVVNISSVNEMQTLFKERILPDLSKNVVCGNSLIGTDIYEGSMFPSDDERKINAMNFSDAFPDIMKKGGFHAIVGNPPYVRSGNLENDAKSYFNSKFISAHKQYDIYVLFIERAINYLFQGGYLGYIVSNKFLISDYGLNIRRYILNNTLFEKAIDVSYDDVFKEASVYPYIVVFKKEASEDIRKHNYISFSKNFAKNHPVQFVTRSQDDYDKEDSIFDFSSMGLTWVSKIEECKTLLGEICKITRGFRPPPLELQKNEKSAEKFLVGKDLKLSYYFEWSDHKVIYEKDKIAESKPLEIFKQPKILFRDIGLRFNGAYDQDGFLCLKTIYFAYFLERLGVSLKYVLAILNSKLINSYFSSKFSIAHIGGGYLRFRKQFVERIPIKILDIANSTEKDLHNKFVFLVDKIIEGKKQFAVATTDKDKNFYENMCNTIDRQIDQLVYELYELTEEEIKIVEGGS